MLRILLMLLLPFALFACTTTEIQDQVKAKNWFAVGKYDASHGFIEKSEKNLQKLSDKFADKSINYAEYLKGYKQALDSYCDIENAYILGVQGMTYRNICDRYPHGWAFYQDWISGRNSRAASM